MTFPFEGGYWIVNGNKYQLRITKKAYEWFACVVYAKPMRYNIWYNIDVDLHPTQHLDDASFHGDLLRIVNSPSTQPKNSLPVYGHQPWISKKISQYSEHFWCKDFVSQIEKIPSCWNEKNLPGKMGNLGDLRSWGRLCVVVFPGFAKPGGPRLVRFESFQPFTEEGSEPWGEDWGFEMLRIGPFGIFWRWRIPRKFFCCWKIVGSM